MIIQNFTKINAEKFIIDDDEFYIETDNDTNNSVWSFPSDEIKYQRCLYFDIDWKTKTFGLKSAILGEGKSFRDITSGVRLTLHRHYYTSLSAFKQFIKEYTECNIKALIKW